jgi:hypothetical protein
MVVVDCCLNFLYILYASVLCTYSITSAGRTAISRALLHCYHTPHKTPGKSLVPSRAVTNRRVTYMLHATSLQTLGTADKLTWRSTGPNCVILQPRCKPRNIPIRCWLTAHCMNGFWLGFISNMLQSHTTNLKNMKAIILWSLRMFVACVVCCQVEVSATSWSLVQRSPTDCGASLCVI